MYSIYNVKRIPGKETYVGRSTYEDGEILIEYGKLSNMLDTLKHELMHIWLYEKGYTIQDLGCFSYEELCEFVALSNSFINKIVKLYLNNIHSANS